MKIASIADIDVELLHGVYEKLLSLRGAYRSLGADVRFFVVDRGRRADEDGVTFIGMGAGSRRVSFLKKNLFLRNRLMPAVESWGPDAVVLRDCLFSRILGPVLRRYPYFVEINSRLLVELRQQSLIKAIHFLLTRRLLYPGARGFFFVSRELSRDPYFQGLRKPFLVHPNGIDCRRYPFLEPAPQAEVNLLFLGTPNCPWHGVDGVLLLAERLPGFRFHLVGPEAGRPLPNVRWHGFIRDEARLDEILRACDAGIGSLSLFRNGMEEGSTLKVRRYLAAGLPAIIGYRDSDIDGPLEFVLELPPRPDNVLGSVDRIRDFVEKVKGRSDLRRAARRFAEERLDIVEKERRRLRFLEEQLSLPCASSR